MSNEVKGLADYTIEYDPHNNLIINDTYTPPVYSIIGQLLGLFKSLNLGYKPDAPSETGIINRVVKGVKVYDPVQFYSDNIYLK